MSRVLLLCAALLSLWALVACERDSASNGSAENTGGKDRLRMVSLSPAISRTLVDFGYADRIVGRTPHCASIEQSIPVTGDLLNIDYEQMIRLDPTHVLVQPPASGIDPHLQKLANERGWTVGQWRLNDRDDIETMVRELPEVLFDDDSPQRQRAALRSAAILNDIAAALAPGAGGRLFQGRVLLVNSVDPPMAFGVMTYLNDVLVALGATNAVAGEGWVQLSLEDIVRLGPEAIILVMPGADPAQNHLMAAGPLASLDLPAVRAERIAILRNPDAFMPSSAVTGVAAELREILRRFSENPS